MSTTATSGMMGAMRAIIVMVTLFVVGGIYAWHYLERRQERVEEQTEISAAAAAARQQNAVADFFAQPAVAVTAKNLTKTWQTNEMTAREQYLGRPLRIDGRVDRVSVEQIDGREFPALYFSEGGACAFNWGEPQPELAKLRRGQRVVVLGQPRGMWAGVQHLTTHCTLESTD